jgi:integrase
MKAIEKGHASAVEKMAMDSQTGERSQIIPEKVTAAFLKGLKPAEKTYRVFADGHGLLLEIRPDGKKYWRQVFRFEGKRSLLGHGVFPDVSLARAREKAKEARDLIDRGVNPGTYKKELKEKNKELAVNSFEAVAREWHAKQKEVRSPLYWSQILRRLELDFFPFIGKSPVAELTAADFLKCLRRTEARGALETVNREKIYCSKVMRYAVATGRAANDPTLALKGAFKPPVEGHLAAVTDVHEVGGLMRMLFAYEGTPTVRAALQILPYIFVRTGELRHMRWVDVEFEKAEWRFTASKTKQQQIVPLARQVVQILREELFPLTGNNRAGWVFPSGGTDKTQVMSDNAILSAMRKMGIPKEKMSGHGFRAMARTILDEEFGFRVDFIEQQLAHAVRDTNGRAYNRTQYLEQRRSMMQDWADILDALRNGDSVDGVKRRFGGVTHAPRIVDAA